MGAESTGGRPLTEPFEPAPASHPQGDGRSLSENYEDHHHHSLSEHAHDFEEQLSKGAHGLVDLLSTDGPGKKQNSKAQRNASRVVAPDKEGHREIVQENPLWSLRLTIYSWTIFLFTSLIYITSYHQQSNEVANLVVCLVVAMGVLALYYYMTHRKKQATTLLVCCLGLTAGALYGYWNYCAYMHNYLAYSEKRHYTNVWADESAAGHSDASVLVFADGVRPDVTKAASFDGGETLYCVAPITTSNSDSSDIQYWAAGYGCCRKTFRCDDVRDPTARAGLVMHDRATIFDYIKTSDMRYLKEAAKKVTATFGLNPSNSSIYVTWVKDIEKRRSSWRSSGWVEWVKMLFLALPIFAIFCYGSSGVRVVFRTCMKITMAADTTRQ